MSSSHVGESDSSVEDEEKKDKEKKKTLKVLPPQPYLFARRSSRLISFNTCSFISLPTPTEELAEDIN
jgi:hypothetical protein